MRRRELLKGLISAALFGYAAERILSSLILPNRISSQPSNLPLTKLMSEHGRLAIFSVFGSRGYDAVSFARAHMDQGGLLTPYYNDVLFRTYLGIGNDHLEESEKRELLRQSALSFLNENRHSPNSIMLFQRSISGPVIQSLQDELASAGYKIVLLVPENLDACLERGAKLSAARTTTCSRIPTHAQIQISETDRTYFKNTYRESLTILESIPHERIQLSHEFLTQLDREVASASREVRNTLRFEIRV